MALAAGDHLGPYEVVAPLGAGGMGEVYRARDPRLGRDVAVKLISTDGAPSPDLLRRFGVEARAAAQLSHPNVVTVHDVGTHDGHPYIVLELLDGETLRETLRGGTPLLRQAVRWALEVSRGLAAAHDRGIVHRDLKPENVFLTTDGRVKILDFGLAKLHEPLVSSEADRESLTATKDTSPGVLLGTVRYMSPEQVKGVTPDSRTDVFALGSVLYEMVAGRRAFGGDTAPEILAEILRDEPPALESVQHGVPASLEAVVRRCLAKRPADRYSSGRAVEAALETVLASLEPSRVSEARPLELRGPYPGLSSFTEADAERFFGREAEVEALWEKLRRGRLMAVIGPSGAGKTSFLRAGLVPARPSGWGSIVSTPGGVPLRALAGALVEELPSDADTVRQLLGFDDPEVAFSIVRRWRQSHLEAVLIVDQFEELFTLSPPEIQEVFAELLGRLAWEADVHILLSLRDDFLMRCHEHEALVPVFEHLTPLGPLSEEGLRRAVTEPTRKEGFGFEDEALVGEILESVEGARGALPLLAFGVARLWEKRDREKKLLTWKAHEEIGGMAGALAQHAEQTLERIGLDKEPVVRELFRNLVTAQWTRAVADREELLSVLPDRETGAQVLDALINARLLTSYEVKGVDPLSRHPERGVDEDRAKDRMSQDPDSSVSSRHRVEVVHESLLRAWPRLARWQAQDEEGAVLRDQLKQAAHLWEEKRRPDDLLWTGTSEREFELWQTRYPGMLTALEDDFARAMVGRVRRRKRIRRVAGGSTIVVLLAVLAVIGGLWRRSVAQEQRAEAAGLFSLAQHRLGEHPTEALAYALASLERADDLPVRYLVLEALWRGPTELRLPAGSGSFLEFSSDGRWVVASRADGGWVLWPSDGGPPTPLEGRSGGDWWTRFSATGDRILGHMDAARQILGVWSVPDGRLLRSFSTGGETVFFGFSPGGKRILTAVARPTDGRGELEWRVWPAAGGEPALVARLGVPFETLYVWPDVDPAWSRVIWADGQVARIAPLEGGRLNTAATISLDHRAALSRLTFDQRGRKAVTSSDRGNVIDIWSLERQPPEPLRSLIAPGGQPGFSAGFNLRLDSSGSRLAGQGGVLWDLAAPPDAAPLRVQGCGPGSFVPPRGRWLATGCDGFASFWSLDRDHPRVLRGHTQSVLGLAFTPDGLWLVSTSLDNTLRLWPMRPGDGLRSRVLYRAESAGQQPSALSMAPDGSFAAVTNPLGEMVIVPLDGGPVRQLGLTEDFFTATAVGPGRHLVAAGSAAWLKKQGLVRVWDPTTGHVRLLDAGDAMPVHWLRFASEEILLVASGPRLRRWSLAGASPRIVDEVDSSRAGTRGEVVIEDLTPNGREALLSAQGRLWIEDLETRATRDVVWNGRDRGGVSFDPSGELVVSIDGQGAIRVGSAHGGEPHLLLGQDGRGPVVVSPDGQWVASGGDDGTIRLWPIPDLSKPPLHTLPQAELLAKLKSLTNLRAVPDPEAPTGWRIDAGPFPGWETVPTW